MSRKVVAGNWKMNKSMSEGQSLVQELNAMSASWPKDVRVIITPPMVYVALLATEAARQVHLAAQNCYHKESGAFTGEVSPTQLKSSSVNYCILGHSERRQYFGETDSSVNEKVKACLEADVTPIICVGESLEQREAGKELEVVGSQLKAALDGLNLLQISSTIIAYEPVWAIGTGKTASSDQAQEIHAFIRGVLAELTNKAASESISILYGGSCKPSNATELFSQPDVDGGLIGGASLNAEDFNAIINSY
ncbi:MAG: triose-phosphate isomerase [Flavobacteriales bacterium]